MDVSWDWLNLSQQLNIEKMQQSFQISTPSHNALYDITSQVEAIVSESGIQSGLVNVYAQGATAAILKEFNITDPLLANVWAMSKSKL